MSELQSNGENEIKTIRLAGVVRESIVDGPGIRVTVFCQGCPHHCPGCHNPVTHDFQGGYEAQIANILAAIDENPLLTGITFSGGEPACQPEAFLALARACKERNLNIWMYSGYRLEELFRMAEEQVALRELLYLTDVLVDGRFQLELRDLSLPYRGSRNQRVIDLRESFSKGHLILYKDA